VEWAVEYSVGMQYVKQFLVATGLFVVFDSVWLGYVANSFYKTNMGDLLASQPNMVAAVLFYVIYLVAMVVFVINPGLQHGLRWVAGRGALLGLAMYATYDLTNQATLAGWPLVVTLVDMTWGVFITTTVSTLTYLILRKR
jgi:uncharacterized membrane protein